MISKAELTKALDIAFKIPGLYGRGEGAFLYRLSRRKGNLVELGCWMGRTTAIMLQATNQKGGRLTSVDAFTAMRSQKQHATAEKWEANLKNAGLAPPQLLTLTTDQASAVYPPGKPISLLFIDAAHSKERVAQDLINWTPRVQVGGVVALHDMFFPSITGVCLAVSEWWSQQHDGKTPFWKCLGLHRYTIAFKRLQ